ncbi:hypothetical protein HYQ45_017708 [Verticillium longisporum]|uniref:Uncharacterized protein n=1 Tax=Verticillium longisporum TaxID=100787 RepID=A0A8I3AIB7_VERLO|nr:hypothetical protein HYQ45_017708 [Verticillium longisporum]
MRPRRSDWMEGQSSTSARFACGQTKIDWCEALSMMKWSTFTLSSRRRRVQGTRDKSGNAPAPAGRKGYVYEGREGISRLLQPTAIGDADKALSAGHV